MCFYHFPSIFDCDFHCILRGFSGIIDGEVQIPLGGLKTLLGVKKFCTYLFGGGQF